MDIKEIVSAMRNEGSDNGFVEVKSAAGGFPQSIAETMCGFANRPGGGVIIFGLDEKRGFEPVEIYNYAELQQRLTQIAQKGLSPAVILDTELIDFEGTKLVVCIVKEAELSSKPVEVSKTGKSYIRQYDGDFVMSSEQKQMFIANRGASKFDHQIVENATIDDLEIRAVEKYIKNVKPTSPKFDALTDSEILLRTGVIDVNDNVTLAGLLALGFYPQQFVPNYSIQASVQRGKLGVVRATNSKLISGSVPEIIEQTIAWVRQNSNVYTTNIGSGKVRNLSEYPEDAIRELVANALIHRDLNPVSMTTPITLVIRDSMLIISNPGGLCGVSIENLGKTASHSRNEWLTHICQSISTVDGESVVERIGSGIPTVIFALESEFRPSARFFDEGIRFTVILTGGEPQIDGVVSNLYDIDSQIKGTLPNLNDTGQPKNHEVIYKLLQKESPLTRAEIMRKTGISDSKSRYALRKLLAENLVKILDNQNSPIAHYAPSAHPSKR